MHNILLDIIEKKKQDLIEQKKKIVLEDIKNKSLAKLDASLRPALRSSTPKLRLEEPREGSFLDINKNALSVIAEIKLTSPTVTNLGSHNEIIERAIAYAKAGADAISFITEKHFFKGDISYISLLKQHVSLPILQKDFVIDEYQIYEAKLADSDALLLIVRYLDTKTLKHFVSLCQKLDIEPIVEINDKEDLAKALATTTNIIAVNARDLRTFEVDIDKACELLRKTPNSFIKLGFSGIHSSIEVNKYKDAGAQGVLVGTELMKAKNINDFINNLKI